MSGRRELVGVILAAGLSSRMGGEPKPLLPIDDMPAVLRCCRAFTDIGARPLVVLGFQAERVAEVLDGAGVPHVTNAGFEQGMFSSVRAGLEAAATVDLAAVLPVDTPLVRGETIGRLARAAGRERELVYPVHDGRRGHPPLLGGTVRLAALSAAPAEGLQEVLAGFEGLALDVPVDDPGTLQDVDVPADVVTVAARAGDEHVPDRDECLHLLSEWKVPDRVVAHSVTVAGVAGRLGVALNDAGAYLNLGLLQASALLHDVRRQSPRHAVAGAALLREARLSRAAAVVIRHMEPPRQLGDVPDEAGVLFLADKLVLEDEPVSLESRLATVLQRLTGDEQAVAAARRRLEAAMRIAAVVQRETGRSVEQLLQGAGGE